MGGCRRRSTQVHKYTGRGRLTHNRATNKPSTSNSLQTPGGQPPGSRRRRPRRQRDRDGQAMDTCACRTASPRPRHTATDWLMIFSRRRRNIGAAASSPRVHHSFAARPTSNCVLQTSPAPFPRASPCGARAHAYIQRLLLFCYCAASNLYCTHLLISRHEELFLLPPLTTRSLASSSTAAAAIGSESMSWNRSKTGTSPTRGFLHQDSRVL